MDTEAQSTSQLLTARELEQKLRVRRAHLRHLEKLGLPVYRLSAHTRRYDLQAVENWLKSRSAAE